MRRLTQEFKMEIINVSGGNKCVSVCGERERDL